MLQILIEQRKMHTSLVKDKAIVISRSLVAVYLVAYRNYYISNKIAYVTNLSINYCISFSMQSFPIMIQYRYRFTLQLTKLVMVSPTPYTICINIHE